MVEFFVILFWVLVVVTVFGVLGGAMLAWDIWKHNFPWLTKNRNFSGRLDSLSDRLYVKEQAVKVRKEVKRS